MPAHQILLELPEMYPKQHEAFYPANNARFICIEASVKSGKTIGAAIWLLHQAWLKGMPGRVFTWVAPVFHQSEIAYRRIKMGLGQTGYAQANDSKLLITLHNGALIQFLSGEHADHLYGDDCWAAVLDECSRMRDTVWPAVRTTLSATKGPAVLIGNVRGKNNWFYRICRKAESETRAFHANDSFE